MHEGFLLQEMDGDMYFKNYLKPRMDKSYKLATSYSGDRAKEIESWKANVFSPHTFAVIETMKPRVLDARPEFTVKGRTEKDNMKAEKVQMLNDYTWEISKMDDQTEDLVSASMTYGIGFLQTFWRQDKEERKYLVGKDPKSKKKKWEKKTIIKYDAPMAEAVDNYAMRYDWRNVPSASKQFWQKRMVLTGAEIRKRYPDADPSRLDMAFGNGGGGDITDYGSVRMETKSVDDMAVKKMPGRGVAGTKYLGYAGSQSNELIYRFQGSSDPDMRFYEVRECYEPFKDMFYVMVNKVPIFEDAFMPNPYNHKETPFIDVPFVRLPFEFEGLGYPLLLEQPQLMINMVKNQRLDAATMSINKMWVVNPLAGIKKEQLIVRPFGIIYSSDPNGVREVEFSDIKESAYREEEALKQDIRSASGIDDFSMGTSGDLSGGGATAVRHLRESTLERVRLFVNHLGSAYATVMRHWISMYGQFMDKKMVIRITNADGEDIFPLIEKDDLFGMFDYRASVLPSIAGQGDIEKKQNMDLFQLLIQMPFIDPEKLVSRTIHPWGWSLNSLKINQDPMQQMATGGGETPEPTPDQMARISPDAVSQNVTDLLGGPENVPSQFSELGLPVDITQQPVPPTAQGIKGGGGLNMGGKVNTGVPTGRGSTNPADKISNQAINLQ